MLLSLTEISKSYGSDIIFQEVSAKIEDKDRIGFVGANGAGKTTLLNIITENLDYDEGDIARSPQLTIGYQKQNSGLSQNNTIAQEMHSIFSDVYAVEDELRDIQNEMANCSDESRLAELNQIYQAKENYFIARDGYQTQVKINTVLNGMGFADHSVEKSISTLSGGEQTRLAIAKLLLEEPSLLILDEPTNHLDFKTLGWLEEYLNQYKGAVLVVSHDRYFLDKLCDKIWEMDRGVLYTYKGNYTKYLQLKEERDIRDFKLYAEQQKEKAKLEDYVARNMVRASTTKMAQSRQKALDKMEVAEKPKNPLAPPVIKLNYDMEPVKDVLKMSNVSIAVGDTHKITLLDGVELSVLKGDKIAIIGGNGAGKTSLLKGVINQSTVTKGTVNWGRGVKSSYYEQGSEQMDQSLTVMETMWDKYPQGYETKIRNMLAALGLRGEEVYKTVSSLSGGERARLKLAIICLAGSNVLVMDEPTNHLDLATKEVLENALATFDGTVIMVSHDRYLLDRIPNRIIEVKGGVLNQYKGRYRDYLKQCANEQPQVTSTKKEEIREKEDESDNQKTYKRGKEARREEAKRRKEYAEAEELIAKLEQDILDIQQQITELASSSDYQKLQDLYVKEQETRQLLEQTEERWLELAE